MRGPVHIIIEKLREADPSRRAARRSPEISLEHLLETKRAFDSVAADYDGPIGNNATSILKCSPISRTVGP